MNLQIKKNKENEINNLLDSMERDFPKQVQRKMFIKAIQKKSVYAILLKDGTNVVGYITYTEIEEYDGIHICYLAIEPKFRSKGYGGKMIELFRKHILNKPLLLEVEDPQYAKDAVDFKIRTKRISFYEKCNFTLVENVFLNICNYRLLLMKDPNFFINSYKRVIKKSYAKTLGSWFFTLGVRVKELHRD